MTVCPSELVQIDSGAPLALFADGLDTAIYRLDPAELHLVEMSRVEGFAKFLTASRRVMWSRRGEHVVRAQGRLRRISAGVVGAAQRHQAGISGYPMGYPGAPVLRGLRWTRRWTAS